MEVIKTKESKKMLEEGKERSEGGKQNANEDY